jgi:O-antigen/teichoic acid export membrane protein
METRDVQHRGAVMDVDDSPDEAHKLDSVIGRIRGSIASLGRGSWLLFIALTIANASNYVFHVVMSRLLGPADYGALGAVLAVVLVISVPSAAIQATVARRVSLLRANGTDEQIGRAWSMYFRTLLPGALVLSAVLACSSPLLARFLHLDSWVTALFAALHVVPAAVGPVTAGALQGTLRFKALALVTLVSVAVRLGVGWLIVAAGGGVAGAVAASVIGQVAALVLALFLLTRRHRPELFTRERSRAFLREVAAVILSIAAASVLMEIDLVLARHYLPPNEAGNYAAAGLLARGVIFATGAITVIAFPRFAQHGGRGKEAYRFLRLSGSLVLAISLTAAMVLTLGGRLALGVTFGRRFAGAIEVLPTVAFAMVALGIVGVLVRFHIAAKSRLPHVLWFVALGEAGVIAMFHSSAEAIALTVLVFSWAVAVLGFLLTRAAALAVVRVPQLPFEVQVDPVGAYDEVPAPELSVVLPCRDPGSGFADTIGSVTQTLDRIGRPYEVLAVLDGRSGRGDGALPPPSDHVQFVRYERQQGKGVALRVGMARARGQYVAFLDGDGDLHAGDLGGFISVMDLYRPDLVIGSKRHPLSSVSYPPLRRLMSWIYQLLIRLLFGLNVRDTQTGMKLIRRDVLDQVLPKMFEKRFAFDLEFLVIARRLGYRRVFEVPITLEYRFDSTVQTRTVFRILLDTAAIFFRRYIVHSYDPAPTVDLLEDDQAMSPLTPALQSAGGEVGRV